MDTAGMCPAHLVVGVHRAQEQRGLEGLDSRATCQEEVGHTGKGMFCCFK